MEVTGQVAPPPPPPPPKTPNVPPPAAPLGATSTTRPQRPQRTPRVEDSVDICEPKPSPGAETEPESKPAGPRGDGNDGDEGECTPDGAGFSRGKRPLPPAAAARKSSGEPKAPRPRGPAHHPVRAASVPYETAVRPGPPHLNPHHAQRAFSVAGTADTQAQTVEDFRRV